MAAPSPDSPTGSSSSRLNARPDAAGEAAFAALVQRHGPMVLDVCRQLLGDLHHAEDAFQAVFLVLARKAGAIRDPDLLGTWLHGVAVRTARKSRGHLARLRRYEESNSMNRAASGPIAMVETTVESVEESAIAREQAAALHEEIDRLPRSFRLPILLCYFEGLGLDEAARRLHWPAGTVRSRLARARDKLRRGLTGRGAVLPAAIAAGLSPKPAAAAVTSALCATTTTAAVRFAAGQSVSTTVSALAREVLRSMLLYKLGLAALTVLALATTAGVGFLGYSLAMGGGSGAGKAVTVRTQVEETGKSPPPSSQRSSPAPGAVQTGPVRANDRPLSPWGEKVNRSIREGVRYLQQQQRPDGFWPDVEGEAKSGTTSLVTLALLAAGEKPDSPTIRKALEFLRRFRPDDLRDTYSIGLQTMVFATAHIEHDKLRVIANVNWLERAQIKPGDPVVWPGSWGYTESKRTRNGDNSNTQYALMGLHAGSEARIPVKPEVWDLARDYWTRCQKKDGSWSYTPDSPAATASMTCAGISSSIVSGMHSYRGKEFVQGETIRNCGKGRADRGVQLGIDWLSKHFQVRENFGNGQQWRYYYLYGLERAARLAGVRFIGTHDWYRVGAEELVSDQDKLSGFWKGALMENNEILATSFAPLVPGQGPRPRTDQQAPPFPGQRLGP